jgi:hypothetical protein
MAEPFDQGEFKRAAFLPEITLELYHQLPEDVCMQVEVVDGWMVRCESPTYSHQTIAHNFVSLLRDPVKNADRKERTCHRVVADLEMLIAEAPKFHFRRPDVLVYRCVEYDRGTWARKPYASDCVLVIEIVRAVPAGDHLGAARRRIVTRVARSARSTAVRPKWKIGATRRA